MPAPYSAITREQTYDGVPLVRPLDDPDYQRLADDQANINAASKAPVTLQQLKDIVARFNYRGVKATLTLTDDKADAWLEGPRSRRLCAFNRRNLPWHSQAVALLDNAAALTSVPGC